MAKILMGRYAAQIEGPFVVFLIGLRVNKILAFHKWIPPRRQWAQCSASFTRALNQGSWGHTHLSTGAELC